MKLNLAGIEAVTRMAECAIQVNFGGAFGENNGRQRDELIGQINLRIEPVERLLVSASVHDGDFRVSLRVADRARDSSGCVQAAADRHVLLSRQGDDIGQIAIPYRGVGGKRLARTGAPVPHSYGSREISP